MSFLFSALYWVACLVLVLVVYHWWSYQHFKRRGIKVPPYSVPLMGHMLKILVSRQHFIKAFLDLYNKYPNERYFGIFQFTQPLIVLKDVEIIKQIAIKDFDHFVEHLFSIEGDFLFGNNLFTLKGQKWRDMRATLSPAFTSSKMRAMFEFVLECSEQMDDYYKNQMNIPENKVRGLIELEMKDVFTRYTNDVIATSAFGLKVNSFMETENEFYLNARDATQFTGKQMIIFVFLMIFPKLGKLLGIQLSSKSAASFFRKLIWGTIKNREENNIIRPDMIHLLMQVRKGTLKHDNQEDDKDAGFATVEESDLGKVSVKREWSDDEIAAQAALFLFAGFESSSILLCFLAHELAIHPEIHKRLQEEIDEVAANIGKPTYDVLQKMKYMDVVVSEVLRMWPPAPMIDRRCVKKYTMPPSNENGKEIVIEKGEGIWIPIYAIHRDSKYFKDPEIFDPERFSDENKANIKPFTFIPFGLGPRNCIGSRFALMEAKAVIFNLLLNFDIVTTAKTQNPIRLNRTSINVAAEKGFWVGLRPRNQSQTNI